MLVNIVLKFYIKQKETMTKHAKITYKKKQITCDYNRNYSMRYGGVRE